MENLNQIFAAIPAWLSLLGGVILGIWIVLCFLVPLMIYSVSRRIKTIEWNMNYFLFGDKKVNARNIKGDWRDSLIEWVVAVVERRQRELMRMERSGYPIQELEMPDDS